MNEKVVSRNARTTDLAHGGNRSPVPPTAPVVLVAVVGSGSSRWWQVEVLGQQTRGAGPNLGANGRADTPSI